MIVGIDLAGSEKRITGLCYLYREHALCQRAKKDKEIISFVELINPRLIAIDAPLSLPRGRRNINERGPHFRICDIELQRLGIKFFPITLGPMRKLTERGLKLKNYFEKKGYEVIEVFPGATQDILGIPRKNRSIERLRKGLEKIINLPKRKLTHDELDAVTCALTGKLWIEGKATKIGDEKEGVIIIPKLKTI